MNQTEAPPAPLSENPATTAPEQVPVDVFADVVCPWCYIGEARLERAAERLGVTLAVRWRPFQLRPEMPGTGLPWRAFAEEKFGGWERATAMFAQVSEVGAQEGLTFDFSRIASAPNTVDAHRLILIAEAEGQGQAAAHALFKAYFTEGRDLNDEGTLLGVAQSIGLDPEGVRAQLAGGAYTEAVAQSQREAQLLGVSGVPFFVLESPTRGRFGVSGAQGVEVFERALALARGQ